MSKSKTILSIALSLAVAMAMLPGTALAAGAVKTVKVNFSAGSNTSFFVADEKLTVKSDMAENYLKNSFPEVVDYEDAKVVSICDVVVAAHIKKYGDKFKNNPSEYMSIIPSQYGGGYINMIFKESTGAQFFIYKEQAKEPAWGGVNNAFGVDGAVEDGSYVHAAISSAKDTSYASQFTYFEKPVYKATAGRSIKLPLKAIGYDESWKPVEVTAPPFTLKILNKKTLKFSNQKANINNKSVATTKFAKVGEHYVSAFEKNENTAFAPIAKVTVGLDKAEITKKTAGKKKATLKWKKVVGAKSYQVYRATKKNGKFNKVATVKKLSYTNKKLKSKKNYYYKVRAYAKADGKAYTGAFSQVVKVKVK